MLPIRIYSGDRPAGVSRYLSGFNSIYIVADHNVRDCAHEVEKEVCAKGVFFIDASESHKNMETVMDLCRWLLDAEAGRDALVLSIGGGITSDIAGFAACIYKRGVKYANFPTTLLAQVDAGIGGKTGVNLDGYKNMLGVIRQPEFTYICHSVLSRLPYRQFIGGAAELVKTFIIDNKDGHYGRAISLLSKIDSSNDKSEAILSGSEGLNVLALAAARIKASIVEKDEYDKGERMKLNLGHTFAHAIERTAAIRSIDISHGEAVAMGIILAARFSDRLYSGDMEALLAEDFRRAGLPVASPFAASDLWADISKDKKAEGGEVRFVLIKAIGDVQICAIGIEEAKGLFA